jgi:hypothetical protein
MSVPLDRLYNFLDSISGHELIIYGWYPHGSKKLQNLKPLQPLEKSWRKLKTQPVLVFHDQEPLDYDFIQWQLEEEFFDISKGYPDFSLLSTPAMQQFLKKMHLRSLMMYSGFFDLSLIVHSEKNSAEVKKYEQNNFVPVYYWSHAIIAQDWFRFAEHDRLLKVKSNNLKTFLIYNRAWEGTREYRLKFAEQLVNTDLHQDCITSFSDVDNHLHYSQHIFKNTDFKINRLDLEKILPKNVHSSEASADYNTQDYQNSIIEVVLETLFDDTRHHLTEKILRPIACGHPFILMSTPGSLQYLKDYGFKTFNGIIDETYDCIQNPEQRLQFIINEMQRISNLSNDQKNQLRENLHLICEHNQKLFFSENFQTHVITEFKQNLDFAVKKVKSGSIGNVWKKIRSIFKEQHPGCVYQSVHQDSDDLEWAYKWIESHTKS